MLLFLVLSGKYKIFRPIYKRNLNINLRPKQVKLKDKNINLLLI